MTAKEMLELRIVTKYYVGDFSSKYNVDALKQKINQIANELQCETEAIQKYVVNHLINNFLSISSDKNVVKEYATSLGLIVEIKQKQQQPAPIKVNLVVYDDSQIDELLARMHAVDWGYTEQYADRLTKADKENVLNRGKISSELTLLTIDTLRECWKKCTNQIHKDVIYKYGIFRKGKL